MQNEKSIKATITNNLHNMLFNKEINFNELPEEIKKEIGGQHDRSIKFFHCEKCRQISISFESVSF